MRPSLITAAAGAGKDVVDVAMHAGMKPDSATLFEYWEVSAPRPGPQRGPEACSNRRKPDRSVRADNPRAQRAKGTRRCSMRTRRTARS